MESSNIIRKNNILKIQSILFLMLAAATLVIIFYLYQELGNKNIELENANRKLEQSNIILNKQRNDLVSFRDSVTNLLYIIRETKNINDSLKSETNRLIKKSIGTKVFIRLHYTSSMAGSVQKITSYLIDCGYVVILSKEVFDNPDWLAYQSSVFYYSDSSMKTAGKLAKDLSEIVGQPVVSKIGAGKNLHEMIDIKENLINIHIVK